MIYLMVLRASRELFARPENAYSKKAEIMEEILKHSEGRLVLLMLEVLQLRF